MHCKVNENGCCVMCKRCGRLEKVGYYSFVKTSFFSVDPETQGYNEPKFIVFWSMLVSLFSMFCFKCKEGRPTLTVNQNGTLVTVRQNCTNCGDSSFEWKSQPSVFGKYPAGNIALSFATLMAGATIQKVLLVFKHMGVAVYQPRTYFLHQKKFLFPLIVTYWKEYQEKFKCQLQNATTVVWSGDARFDSMGHSAKYGVYSMFNCNFNKILHFELVQVCMESCYNIISCTLQKKGPYFHNNNALCYPR